MKKKLKKKEKKKKKMRNIYFNFILIQNNIEN